MIFLLIQIYIPIRKWPCGEVEMYFEKKEQLIEREKIGAWIIITEDWNAVVAEGKEGEVVGKFGRVSRKEREMDGWWIFVKEMHFLWIKRYLKTIK